MNEKILGLLYFFLVYFNWLVFLGLSVRIKNGGLIRLSVLIGFIQISEFCYHLYSYKKTMGTPDQLYVWILPLVTSVFLSGIVIVVWFSCYIKYKKTSSPSG